jgi:hypothetical protein
MVGGEPEAAGECSPASTVRRIGIVAAVAALGVLGSVSVLGGRRAQAAGSFSCGPNTRTYAVTSLNDGSFVGVRCVEFPDAGPPLSFAWYGEGSWGGQTYRNAGKATANADGVSATASSADLYGADTRNVFNGTINIQVTTWDLGIPTEINVTGAWHEHWSFRYSVDYAPLPKTNICGDNFDQYLVGPTDKPTEVDGVRCVLPLGNGKDTVWYGFGHWYGDTYTHIGILYANGAYGESADLCDPAFGTFCNRTGAFDLTFNHTGPHKIVVGGAWNELWQ